MIDILTFPDGLWRATRARFSAVSRALTATGPFAPRRRVVGPVDQRWQIDLALPRLDTGEWPEVEAFLLMLEGQSGFVRLWDPQYEQPRGVAAGPTGSPAAFTDGFGFTDGTLIQDGGGAGFLAATALAGATVVTLGGLVASQSASLKANDRFELDGLLYAVAGFGSFASDGSGQATVPVWPALRRGAAAGSPVSFAKPSSVFQMTSDSAVDRVLPMRGDIAFTFLEAPEALMAPDIAA